MLAILEWANSILCGSASASSSNSTSSNNAVWWTWTWQNDHMVTRNRTKSMTTDIANPTSAGCNSNGLPRQGILVSRTSSTNGGGNGVQVSNQQPSPRLTVRMPWGEHPSREASAGPVQPRSRSWTPVGSQRNSIASNHSTTSI